MGSVFLYLAIVLMWLCVLVPMWLRRDRNDEAELVPAFGAEDTASDTASDAGAIVGEDTGEGDTLSEPAPTPMSAASADPTGTASSLQGASPQAATPQAATSASSPREATAAADGEDVDISVTSPPPPSRIDRRRAAARRRARLIARRRRRMLWSILLVIASAVTASTGVVSWLGVLPSVFLLLGYLVMLRIAVRIDAERRAHVARARAERARRRRAREQALALAAQQTAAEILEFDASRRVEVFDQYADPPRRAVGD